ncbi:MAG: hypothetical protein WC700_14465 [Gemmatimonadaceae bacterium]|jgi:hypothetical protein
METRSCDNCRGCESFTPGGDECTGWEARAKHTPEPWTHPQESFRNLIAGPDLAKVADVWTSDRPDAERFANAARIVACVNACAGIDPEAVPLMLDALQECITEHGAAGYYNPAKYAQTRLDYITQVARAALAKAGR